MLLKDFYKIISMVEAEPKKYRVIILINETHDVFKGHFPGNPIMPGVCMMQIIKELSEKITEKPLILQTLTNVKFMALINPFTTPELILDLEIATVEDGLIKVKNTTYFNETVALKLSSVYAKV